MPEAVCQVLAAVAPDDGQPKGKIQWLLLDLMDDGSVRWNPETYKPAGS